MNDNQICAYCDEIRETTLKRLYKIQNQRKEISMLHKKCKSQQAEIERLQNAYKQCAWERDVFAEDMKEEIKKDCSYLALDIKIIKAEAVKEFAERLKGNKQLVKARLEDIGECLLYGVLCGDIDNLVKEMVGES